MPNDHTSPRCVSAGEAAECEEDEEAAAATCACGSRGIPGTGRENGGCKYQPKLNQTQPKMIEVQAEA